MNKITLGFFRTRSTATIKTVFVLFAVLLMNTQTSWGQLLVDDFNYAGLLTANGWTAHSGTLNPITVSASTITYPGYASSDVGGEVAMTINQDVNKGFTAQTSGTIYASCLVNVSTAAATAAGDYFFHLGTTPMGSTFRARVFVKRDALNNVSFGVSMSSGTIVNYSPAIYSLNTTYLIVVKYDFVSGATNDLASIFVNPPLNSAVPAGWIVNTDTPAADLANISTVALRQAGTALITGLKLDGIRVSKTWSDIVGVETTTTWNGSAWSNGIPDATKEAIIDGAYTTAANGSINAKKLTVTSVGSLIASTGVNVIVQDNVINNGSLVIQDNSNLIQVNDVANTGVITVNRTSNPLFRLDYTMWSSPVMGAQTLLNFSPATIATRFYTYDNTLGTTGLYTAVASPSTTTFTIGTGYLIRMPDTDLATDYNAGTGTLAYPGVFTGTANNGTVPLNGLTSDKYYAVGNPYPSTIGAQLFLDINGANTDGVLYFWRKKNAALGSAYATFTSGGATVPAVTGQIPDGTIAVGQGFIVKTGVAANSLTFTNAMRTGNNTAQFFKTKQLAQKDRVWLNLTNTTGVFSQALVAYIADATSGLDRYDGKYINDSPIALTSNINNEEYTIQGRPAFDASDVVALNFKTDVAGDYTIAIDHVDGLFSGSQDIYLLDSKTGTETNLKTSSYTFTAAAAVDNTRFSLKFQKTLSLDPQELNDNSVIVYKNGGVIYVNSGAKTINNIKVFDILGRVVAERNNVKANTASIQNLRASNQVLIVKVTTDDNQVISKKVEN
jgi:hypothetical protein